MQPVRRDYGPGLAVVVVGREPLPCLDTLGDPDSVLVVAGDPAPVAAGLPVLDLGEDLPRPAAVNRAVAGLDPAVGLVLVTEPHVRWGAGALDALRSAAARRPRAALVAPRTPQPRPSPPRPAQARRAGGGPLARLRSGQAPQARPAGPGVGGDGAGDEVVDSVPGSAVLVRRAAFDSVGGYDGRLPAGRADVDLADRLRAAGWLVVRTGGATADPGPGDPAGATVDRAARARSPAAPSGRS